MNNKLIIILSDTPIKEKVYYNYDIINVNKQSFGKNEDDLLWSINALNYSNFLKNEVEFERTRGYQKVMVQKINNLKNINQKLLVLNKEFSNYNIYTNDFEQIIRPRSYKGIDIINPFNWVSNSLTHNIACSITSEIYDGHYLSDTNYWNGFSGYRNTFGHSFYSHCVTHNLSFICIK